MKVAQLVCKKFYEDKKGILLELRQIADGKAYYYEGGWSKSCPVKEFAERVKHPTNRSK